MDKYRRHSFAEGTHAMPHSPGLRARYMMSLKYDKKKIEKVLHAHNKEVSLKLIDKHNTGLKTIKKQKRVTWADKEMIGKVTLPRRRGPNVVWTG